MNQLREHLHEAEKLKEKVGSALQAKEDEISFLRGHVSQLTQSISQLSLKPGEEKIKKGLVAVLEMTRPSLSPSDRILWILANSGGKMERRRLRQDMEMTYTDLDPILTKLELEGKIRRSGEIIRL
jgi:hypothetical protein